MGVSTLNNTPKHGISVKFTTIILKKSVLKQFKYRYLYVVIQKNDSLLFSKNHWAWSKPLQDTAVVKAVRKVRGWGGGCKLVLSFKVLITESCRENTRANLKLESPFSSYGSYDGRGGGPHYIHKQKCGELVWLSLGITHNPLPTNLPSIPYTKFPQTSWLQWLVIHSMLYTM